MKLITTDDKKNNEVYVLLDFSCYVISFWSVRDVLANEESTIISCRWLLKAFLYKNRIIQSDNNQV